MSTDQIIEDVCSKWEQDQYAMYLRKSRTDLELEALGEGETLARHKHMLEALAAKHEISTDQITVYQEMVSGESIDERPEMQRLLSDVYANKYAGVLVVEVERLARGNTKDQGEVADAFQATSTKIYTPAKVYDPHNEFDQEYFEFGLFMSRREYKTIKRRMDAGKIQSVQEGNYIGSRRVYGYDIVRKSKKDRILVAKPGEAEVVQMIFDWFTEDRKSHGWIARELTDMKIPTINGNPEWNKGTIKDILANVHHNGKVSWHNQVTTKVFDEEAGKLVKKVISNSGNKQIYEGKHEGIISQEQFQKAQDLLAITKAAPPVKQSKEIKNPLAGIMRCSKCGTAFLMIDYTKYPSTNYNTQARFTHPYRKLCKMKSATVSVVMDALVEGLKAFEADFMIRMENQNDQKEAQRHQDAIKTMEAELSKIESRKRKLMDSWESDEGLYTRDEFIERKQMYTKSIDQLKEKIQEAKKNAPEPIDYSVHIANIHSIIDCLRNDEISAAEKNVFLKQYIERIDYDIIDFGERKGGKPVLDIYLY